MSDSLSEDDDLPAEWKEQGWTKETAHALDEDNSEAWGEASASLTPADPSSVSDEESQEGQA